MPFRDNIWRLPLRLGVLAMLVTIPLVVLAGMVLFDLPLGAALLLGAILAPTDPVLASDVQIKDVGERDRIRCSLTGEGFNPTVNSDNSNASLAIVVSNSACWASETLIKPLTAGPRT